MSIIVRNLNDYSEKEYDYIEDALRDIVDDEMVIDYIDNVWYEPVDIAGYKFNVSKVLKKCLSDSEWDEFVEDFIVSESEYLLDELKVDGEFDYWGYKLIKSKNG